MEIFWIIIGVLLLLAGLAGSLFPVLPGPAFCYAALLLLQFTGGYPFSTTFLVVWGVIVIAVMLADNVMSVWGTRQSGGSPYGIVGSIIGLAIGMIFFPPAGLVVGPLIGAFLGELISGKSSNRAFRSAMGSFLGFLFGTLLNVIISVMMAYYFIMNI